MQNNFRTYQLAVEFYRAIKPLKMEGHLKDQLRRAASSVVLNLAEGAGRGSKVDQRRFYQIAMGVFEKAKPALNLLMNPVSKPCNWQTQQLRAFGN
jgi:four helix bundle protein